MLAYACHGYAWRSKHNLEVIFFHLMVPRSIWLCGQAYCGQAPLTTGLSCGLKNVFVSFSFSPLPPPSSFLSERRSQVAQAGIRLLCSLGWFWTSDPLPLFLNWGDYRLWLHTQFWFFCFCGFFWTTADWTMALCMPGRCSTDRGKLLPQQKHPWMSYLYRRN